MAIKSAKSPYQSIPKLPELSWNLGNKKVPWLLNTLDWA
jgi:hypothetical protein